MSRDGRECTINWGDATTNARCGPVVIPDPLYVGGDASDHNRVIPAKIGVLGAKPALNRSASAGRIHKIWYVAQIKTLLPTLVGPVLFFPSSAALATNHHGGGARHDHEQPDGLLEREIRKQDIQGVGLREQPFPCRGRSKKRVLSTFSAFRSGRRAPEDQRERDHQNDKSPNPHHVRHSLAGRCQDRR